MTKRTTFWRSVFELTIRASARFPRLVPAVVVAWADDKFYDACVTETLRRPPTREDSESQRRSWAYGQVAMHDPTITRERVDAIADTMPAPGESWACLAGDVDGHDAGVVDERDLHDAEDWRLSRGQRKGWEA